MRAGSAKRVVTEPQGLPRQFWLLAGGIFVFLIGVEMCYPVETIYLNRQLGVSMTHCRRSSSASPCSRPFRFRWPAARCATASAAARCSPSPSSRSMTLFIGLGLTRDLGVIVALIAFEAAFGWAQFITASNAMSPT